MSDTVSDDRSWFLIHTKPRQEERTTANLRAWNVETLAPLLRDSSYDVSTGRRSETVKPLFARYVFARFDLERSVIEERQMAERHRHTVEGN